MAEVILEVDNLKKYFPIKSKLLKRQVGNVKAVNNVSFTLQEGETMGIVGESGCGKSTLARVLMNIYPPTSGQIYFNGKDLAKLSPQEQKKQCLNIQMVFQDPYSSLNPKMKVKDIIAEPIWVNGVASKAEAMEQTKELLKIVGLRENDGEKYPHQFSGGQRQRVGIARAIALNPKIIIADEAVSALDVSIQAQILNLLKELKKKYGLSYIFISHNLSVVKHISDKVGVMYLGKMVEYAGKQELYENAMHPYTKALLSAAPVMGRRDKTGRIILKGDIPNPADPPTGCPFHTRCSFCRNICREKEPELEAADENQWVACHIGKKEYDESKCD